MLGIRERICFELARRMLRPPAEHTQSDDAYQAWREEELSDQWRYFSDDEVRGKDVIDFGCGSGQLALFLSELAPQSMVGVELAEEAVQGARRYAERSGRRYKDRVRFEVGAADRLPLPDGSADTLLAFDCVEHIMEPRVIFAEWHRVLRKGGKVLIWWSPYKSPYGPHLEAVMPLPWAHVVFGEQATLHAAKRVYDLPEFVPRKWHLDEQGMKKPNPLAGLDSFRQQGYLNQLAEREFLDIARQAGLPATRFEPHTFGAGLKHTIGAAMLRVPRVREYFTSFYIIECTRD